MLKRLNDSRRNILQKAKSRESVNSPGDRERSPSSTGSGAAEPPVVRGGSGYRTTSMDGVTTMIHQLNKYNNNSTTAPTAQTQRPGSSSKAAAAATESGSQGVPSTVGRSNTTSSTTHQSQLPTKQRPYSPPPQRFSSLTASTSPKSSAQPRMSGDSFDVGLDYDGADTAATSTSNLPALQTKGYVPDDDNIDVVNEDDPASYDIVVPANNADGGQTGKYSLETRGELIFSREHLQAIFKEPSQLIKFSSFLGKHKFELVPLLLYYLDALKALETINYSNAIAETLDPLPGHEFTEKATPKTANAELEQKATLAFDVLTKEALPAFVTHIYTQTVSSTIKKRITGKLPPHLRDTSDGLAEVFCLSDPSRPDNPLVLASEEFHRTTQYGVAYAMGRNCRFLQGPSTNQASVKRLSEAIAAGRDHVETFMNYRRDGSPFLNLLMVAPLRDNRGSLRYFLGAQVDVSGLAKECSDLYALQQLLANKDGRKDEEEHIKKTQTASDRAKASLVELSEMFNATELATIRNSGGRMHQQQVPQTNVRTGSTPAPAATHRPRLLLKDPSSGDEAGSGIKAVHGKLKGIYQHYLLVRPYPSLRILFTSPSLRFPGILQSPFMNRIGSSERVRNELLAALEEGRGVTAKVRWLVTGPQQYESPSAEQATPSKGMSAKSAATARPAPVPKPAVGRSRWIHCTPMFGGDGEIGVWMVVLVDEHGDIGGPGAAHRIGGGQLKTAPPVPNASDLPRSVAAGLAPEKRTAQKAQQQQPQPPRPQRISEQPSRSDLQDGDGASDAGSLRISDASSLLEQDLPPQTTQMANGTGKMETDFGLESGTSVESDFRIV